MRRKCGEGFEKGGKRERKKKEKREREKKKKEKEKTKLNEPEVTPVLALKQLRCSTD